MNPDVIDRSELHEALFHAITTPMIAVDRGGNVVEWNHAAEDYTGIPRSDAIGTEVWELQARIAPARIPYEKALRLSHTQFDSFVTTPDTDTASWVREFDGEILSTRGELRHIHSEVFPLRLRNQLFFVGVFSTVENVSQAQVSA